MTERTTEQISGLEALLKRQGRVRVAVSGGVDSMTLALLAGRCLNGSSRMFHAVSPAVPAEATARVRTTAEREGWRLELVDAEEFRDPDYLRNPHDRCFYCKNRLYASLAAQGDGRILSGANLDDLSDYRPGLQAARRHRVVHPFVECGVDKASVRRICRHLGYPELARLPASPCLSSRVETGIAIEPGHLGFVHQVETGLRENLAPEVIRCRVRHAGIAVELDPGTLEGLSRETREQWRARIADLAVRHGLPAEVSFEPYRMGSAFVRPALASYRDP